MGKEPEKKLFDYGAVLYPEGLMDERLIFLNHRDIYKVVAEGYSDADFKANKFQNIREI